MEEGVINSEAASGGRVKNCKLAIFYSSPKEIGNGVCLCVKGDCVERGILRLSPLNVYPIPYVVVMDILSNFFLVGFVDENQGVMLWIHCIIFDPVSARMICIFLFAVSD